MSAPNQPIFRSNAIKHYMQGREKHEFPRFVSLPTTILLWVLLALFVAATILVWSEQVPTYVAAQGIVVMQYPAQPVTQPTVQPTVQPTALPTVQPTEVQPTVQPVAQPAIQPFGKSAPAARRLVSATEKPVSVVRRSAPAAQRPTPAIKAPELPTPVSEESASATERPVPAMEKLVSVAERPAPAMVPLVSVAEQPVSRMQRPVSVAQEPIPTVMAIFFLSPAQAQSLHAGMPIGLNLSSSGRHIDSQITTIVPDVMSPAALRSLFHLENTTLSITQPSMIVVVKLDNALATRYVGSLVTANLQLGSQRLISFLPGIGGLFGQ